jgi:hypothetical protein
MNIEATNQCPTRCIWVKRGMRMPDIAPVFAFGLNQHRGLAVGDADGSRLTLAHGAPEVGVAGIAQRFARHLAGDRALVRGERRRGQSRGAKREREQE